MNRLIGPVTVLLLAAFLIEPAPAAAADGGIKLDLRLHGGYSRLAAGDVNTGSGGLFEFYKLFAEYGDYALEGGYEPLHGGTDAGADLIFLLSRRLGIGIGVGFLRSAGDADMTLTPPDSETLVFDGGAVLSAFPIRLGLYTSLPLVGKLSLTAHAGGAFYAGLRFKDRYHVEAGPVFSTQEITGTRTSLSKNLGFQGGLGFQYDVSPRMGVFVEAQGRYARFENFGSASVYLASAEGGSDTREGKIYLRTQTLSTDPLILYNMFQVASTPPPSDPPDLVIREPKFDLSGFCLQMGIRIRL
jgi:opacity protein-like surface antigen